jgi:hypothetical protein
MHVSTALVRNFLVQTQLRMGQRRPRAHACSSRSGTARLGRDPMRGGGDPPRRRGRVRRPSRSSPRSSAARRP